MRKRTMHMARIKPECLETYKEHHHHVWPNLDAVYRKAGFTNLSCFMHDNLLLVCLEYDDAVYPAAQAWLDKNEVQKRSGRSERERTGTEGVNGGYAAE